VTLPTNQLESYSALKGFLYTDMAHSNRLVKTTQLKTNLLHKSALQKSLQLSVDYDKDFDALYIRFVAPDPSVDTVVHFIDDHVAFLYRADDMEIVGLQVEDFELSFLPSHANVMRVWKASDAGITFEDLGDMMLEVGRRKPKVAREIVRATEDVLGEPGVE
jgi:hypothetical protein